MKSALIRYREAFAFIEFLYRRHNFYLFMDNFIRFASPYKDVSLLSFLTTHPSEMFVSDAFKFDETCEGFDYWKEVDMSWNDFLTENIGKL